REYLPRAAPCAAFAAGGCQAVRLRQPDDRYQCRAALCRSHEPLTRIPMRDYRWLEEYCLNRFGSRAALEARLPVPRPVEQLRELSDDRYLSTIALRVFRAGLKHSVVDARWPAFESEEHTSELQSRENL